MKAKLTSLALGVLLAPTAFGQFQYEQLKSFGPAEQTGTSPTSLIEGSDGALYGTTSPSCFTTNGTTFTCFDATVFRLNRDGSGYTVLHHFTVPNTDTGGPAIASLLEGCGGALYGATHSGGPTNVATIFKLNKDGGSYSVLSSFSFGGHGIGGLVEGSDGVLYGTTYDSDGGTIFKVNKDGSSYDLVHVFTDGDGDGSYPTAALVEGTDGALYGTTAFGGTNGAGTVFRISKDGSSYAVLHSFGSEGDGRLPFTGLIEVSDGALYGTTSYGGMNDWGTVFKLNKDGSAHTVLHSSSGASGEGSPASLVEGNNGVLYGTKSVPCRERCFIPGFGTVFTLNTDGSGYAVLHSFTGTNMTGRGIEASVLVKGSDAALYGATRSGGDMNLGTIFTLRPQPVLLPPMVSAGGVIVRFMGRPGSTNQIQRTGTLGENWLTLTNLVTPTNGVVEFTDQAPPQASAFYRIRLN